MSTRSPTADGLTVSPNALGDANNSAATAQELQNHCYWGRYAATTDLPNVGTVDGSPVAGVNPAAAPAYAKMAPGDEAYVQATGCLYVLQDRGTVSGNDAVWACQVNSGVQATIRDAHVIVVAQDGGLSSLAATTIPPLAPNSLNLSATGEAVGVTCDYLDPGDGSQLQLALAAAGGAGVGIDIRLRGCFLQLDATTVGADGFLLPSFCALIGQGVELSVLAGATTVGLTQTVITMSTGSSIQNLQVRSDAPTAAPGGTQLGVVQCIDPDCQILNCQITVQGSLTVDRVSLGAIFAVDPGPGFLVSDCDLRVDSLWNQPTPLGSAGVGIGDPTASSPILTSDPTVRNTTLRQFTNNRGSASSMVIMSNLDGGAVHDCEHHQALTPDASIRWNWNGISAGGARVRGPRIQNNRIYCLDNQDLNATGIEVGLSGAPGFDAVAGVLMTKIEDNEVYFDINVATNPNAGTFKTGIRLLNDTTDGAIMVDSSIRGNKIWGHNRGIQLGTTGGTGTLRSVLTAENQAREAVSGNSQAPRGFLAVAGVAGGKIVNTGVGNSDYSGADGATGICLEIADADVSNSIVLGNNLTPGLAAAALTDNGFGTEAAHNITI